MTIAKSSDPRDQVAFLGIRLSIWGVLIVLAGAAVGAALSGSLYGPATTFGAIFGLMMAAPIKSFLRRKK